VSVLLDTCAFIWLCSEPEKFSVTAKNRLSEHPNPELFLSEASIFEIAIKCSQGKMELPGTPRRWIGSQLSIWGIHPLPISQDDIFTSTELPWHHKDPFDRLILASAKNNNLPILTADRLFSHYDVELIW